MRDVVCFVVVNSVLHPTEKLGGRRQAELQAEADLMNAPIDTLNFSPEVARQIQHELQAYRLELKLRNEELRRMQAELEQKKLAAENRQLQKTESLNRMAEAIAHHFNNQLAAVMMCLELARNDLPLNAVPIIEHLALAMKAARDAARVSSLLLTYLGRSPGKPEPLELSEVCRSHLIIVRISLARNVTLETDFPSPGPVIHADVNQFQQVVTNLVLNAGEAMVARGGSIRVALRTVVPADIPAAHRLPVNWQAQAPAYACLEVADAGCGIAPHDLEKLGDPFFTNKLPGRGLGLSAVLGIVRAHQGVLTVESRLDQGSTFRVFLPVTTEPVLQRPEPVVQAPFIPEGIHVLLVDDELAVRRAVMQALGRLGFVVLTAADGLEAVDLFRQNADKISLVLCDLTMPRMSGWETLAALRLLAPDLPVILASGYNEAYAMAGYHPEQPQAFLNKPYTLSELRHTLSEVLQHAGANRLKTGRGKTSPQGRL